MPEELAGTGKRKEMFEMESKKINMGPCGHCGEPVSATVVEEEMRTARGPLKVEGYCPHCGAYLSKWVEAHDWDAATEGWIFGVPQKASKEITDLHGRLDSSAQTPHTGGAAPDSGSSA